MCVRVSYFGLVLPCARGKYFLIFMPGYAAAWWMRSLSTSNPLFSALASAAWRTLSVFCAALMGYLPE